MKLLSLLKRNKPAPEKSILIVRVRGADVKALVEYHDAITKQLKLKEDTLVVLGDSAEINVASFPTTLFDGGADADNTK